MTPCPKCHIRPAYVGLTEIGPCEQCHTGTIGTPLVSSSSGVDTPIGLIGGELRAWCSRRPDQVVLAQESDTGIEYRVRGGAMLSFKFPHGNWAHLNVAFQFTESVICTGVEP